MTICSGVIKHLSHFTAPPGQPRSLAVDNIGATWVHISWEAPLSIDFPITRYEIIARPLNNADALVVKMSTPDNQTFANITNLYLGTTYNFSIVAVIEAGEMVVRGVESEPVGGVMTVTNGKLLFLLFNYWCVLSSVWFGMRW